MKRLTKNQIVLLHKMLIAETGGMSGIRDDNLLESALSAPFAEFGGDTPYPTVEAKAARLAFGLIKNHPFVDGNKRIGILAMLTFLEINGIELSCTDDELISLGLAIADGTFADKDILQWLFQHN